MTKTTVPHGENLRNAIRWLSDQARLEGHYSPRKISRDTVEKASLRFDLTPLEEEFLTRKFVTKENDGV